MLGTTRSSGDRLNVLLTEDPQQRWSQQLPKLLEPQGVRSIFVGNVEQALQTIGQERIHAVVVNLALPMNEPGRFGEEPVGGLKLLKVIQRLQPAPPAVVVRGRRFDRADNRLLSEALRLEAFSVLDEPVELEQLLEVLRRMLQRHYGTGWPGAV